MKPKSKNFTKISLQRNSHKHSQPKQSLNLKSKSHALLLSKRNDESRDKKGEKDNYGLSIDSDDLEDNYANEARNYLSKNVKTIFDETQPKNSHFSKNKHKSRQLKSKFVTGDSKSPNTLFSVENVSNFEDEFSSGKGNIYTSGKDIEYDE